MLVDKEGMTEEKKWFEDKAQTIPQITKELKCRILWSYCRNCVAPCEFEGTDTFEGKRVLVSVADAKIKKLIDERRTFEVQGRENFQKAVENGRKCILLQKELDGLKQKLQELERMYCISESAIGEKCEFYHSEAICSIENWREAPCDFRESRIEIRKLLGVGEDKK